jgi:hypothetical protein
VYRILVEHEGRGLLGRSRRRWEGSIKVYIKEVFSMDWIHLAQDRDSMWPVVNTVMKFCVPQSVVGESRAGVRNLLSSRGAVTLSRKSVLHGIN